ncbi:MAG TPA: Ldh family oxidoreductase [Stellaceae bacterium]|nr:Ldh family oxidoreductase [Stellaceae bacterium]
MSDIRVSLDELRELLQRILTANGMASANAAVIAGRIVAAERDGSPSHGLIRLPGYLSSLKSGWVDGRATPVVEDPAPGLVAVDARNGFAQPALAAGLAPLLAKTRSNGVAALLIRNSHHFSALWPDVEPIAEAGFIAFAFVNARSRVMPWGGTKKLFGTNPMAFACPRRSGPPLVWDQASSIRAQGDVLVMAKRGESLPPGIGFDAEGNPTTDPKAVLDGGSIAPFGGHKGSSIALMVELMAAALTGGRFGFEDASAAIPGAQTSNAGEAILAIDPQRVAGEAFLDRAELLLQRLAGDGEARLPGDRRYAHRAIAIAEGLRIPRQDHDDLLALARPS